MIAIVQKERDVFDVYSSVNQNKVCKDISFRQFIETDLLQQKDSIFIPKAIYAVDEKPVLLLSEDSTGFIKDILPLKAKVYSVKEKVDLNGNLIIPLAESNINKVLRFVYQQNNKNVNVALVNSIQNDSHERILKNLLSAVLYNVNLSSEEFEFIE